MNVILLKTLRLCFFICIFIFASCSTSSRTGTDYTKNKSHRSKSNHRKSQKERIAKYPKNKKSNKSVTKVSKNDAQRNQVIDYAKSFHGIPYVYGGKKANGFDCSGFTSHVFVSKGFTLYGNTNTQSSMGRKIPISKAKKGDLIFFGKKNKISHVAIIVENSKHKLVVIHSTSSKGVITQNIKGSKYWTPKILFAVDVMSEQRFAIN